MGQVGAFIVNHWQLSTALIIILVLLVWVEVKRKATGAKNLTPVEAVRMINHADAVMLDIRDDSEFKEGHILNAVHIPLGLLDSRVNQLEKFSEKPIIVYCRSGQRSSKAITVLHKHGYRNAHALRGGLIAWQNANLPVLKS